MSAPDTAGRLSEESQKVFDAVAETTVGFSRRRDALRDLYVHIAQLELEARRLQVLEEILKANALVATMTNSGTAYVRVFHDIAPHLESFHSFREAADAEILRRSNTGDTP